MSSHTPDLAENLRSYIREYGSVNQLAHESGVPQPVLSRFLSGKRDIKLATLEKLARVLSLEISRI